VEERLENLTGMDLGRYHILEPLGQGGMATVHKAYDTRLEREVAVKIIRTELFGSAMLERLLKRFEREAKGLAKLIHPNIVSIIDYGEYEGRPYLVMPYLPGGTLKQRLGQPLPWQEAARLLLPVARALQYTHQQCIIHRDVKPSNILITPSGEPMLTDFGIAKILDVEEGQTLTGTGVGVGTPEYMAPEQWVGKATVQSDVYSLGVVLYEMVTGRKPYTADTPTAVLLKQASESLPVPRQFVPGLPEGVEKVLCKALEKQPENRYTCMSDFVNALDGLLKMGEIQPSERDRKKQETIYKLPPVPILQQITQDELTVPAASVSSVAPPRNVSPIRRWLFISGIALVVIVLGIIGGLRLNTPARIFPTKTPTDTLLPLLTNTPLPIHTDTPPIMATNTPIPSLEPSQNSFSIGQSVNRQDLKVTCLGSGYKTLVIAGSLSGNEQNTKTLVDALFVKFNQTSLPLNTTLCFMPVINPDGMNKNSRLNAHDVDLNRNWDTRNWSSVSHGPYGTLTGGGGSHPFSEPETQAYSTFLQNQYQKSSGGFAEIMYHSRFPPIGLVQPGYVTQSKNYIPDTHAAMLAQAFARQIGSSYSESYPDYTITGELINWCGEQGIICFDVLLPDFNPSSDSQVLTHFNAIQDVINSLSP
jgi:serine/threonine protein kinase